MTEEVKQEGQKTVVSFVAGLLIGGLLVWIFGSTPETQAPEVETPADDIAVEVTTDTVTTSNDDETGDAGDAAPDAPTMTIGEGSVEVSNQPAGTNISLEGATFPTEEGWVAVRTYQNGQLGSILGAARYSQSQGLIPESVPLLASTISGGTYAVVFFSDDGNREFNLDGDVQLDTEPTEFTAQ